MLELNTTFPKYRTEKNIELQNFIETLISSERKNRLKEILKLRTKHLCFVAENFIDDHNINAIVRSSECFGMQDFYDIQFEGNIKKSRSVNRGAFQWTNIYNSRGEDRFNKCIKHLKQHKYKIVVAAMDGTYTPNSLPIDKPLAIIFGNEHLGLSQAAKEIADYSVQIPIYGFTESFNVSVASSIIGQSLISRIRNSEIDFLLSENEKEHLYYQWLWYSIKNPDIVYKEWLKSK